jgi:chemotaxis protein methyltransferase CheR
MAGQLNRTCGNGAKADADATDELEALLFLTALESRFGADFLGFDPESMRPKIAACAADCGAETISALQGMALRDERLAADVIRALSRSTAPALADESHLMALRCALLPLLRSAPWPAIWLADCTSAHVPVLLLALLQEEDLLARTRVFATCGSEHAVDAVRGLTLSGDDVERLQEVHRGSGGKTPLTRYLRKDGGRTTVVPELGAAVSWHVHHLGTDASFREFNAVIAPRPLAEYGKALRDRALRVFGDSLCPFGLLQLRDAHRCRDALPGAGFEPVLGDYGLYRRVP